jgi:hypothetical protein
VRANRARWPVAAMARLLEVSTSGFYAWLVREPSSSRVAMPNCLHAFVRCIRIRALRRERYASMRNSRAKACT